MKNEGEIWFAIFTFAGSSGIDDTMLHLACGGVKFSTPAGPSRGAVPQWLKHPHIELRVPKKAGA